MAEVSKDILERMRSTKADPRQAGAHDWIEKSGDRDKILVTIVEYLKGRADGTYSMTYGDFTALLREEFGFPFERHSTRAYMERYHRDLFMAQMRRRG
jgi:hypothetical protein